MQVLEPDSDREPMDSRNGTLGCLMCPWKTPCGGWSRRGGGWSCLDYCCGSPGDCDRTCPKNVRGLAADLIDVERFDLEGLGPLENSALVLPRSIPVWLHGSHRTPVGLDWAAVPLESLLRMDGPGAQLIDDDAAGLRRRLGLTEGTRLLLRGTGEDRALEHYWYSHREGRLAQRLARLGFSAAIPPNYSHWYQTSPLEHMKNRRRTALVADSWAEAGIPVIPYIAGIRSADWDDWLGFLRDRPGVTLIAKEFGTGLRIADRANEVASALHWLQGELGRQLHLVVMAGGRHRELIGSVFGERVTFLDTNPFMWAQKRRVAVVSTDGRLRTRRASPDAEVAALLQVNADTTVRHHSATTVEPALARGHVDPTLWWGACESCGDAERPCSC